MINSHRNGPFVVSRGTRVKHMTIVDDIEAMFVCPYGGGENLWRPPARPGFDARSYPARVRFAVWAICARDHSCQHDTCFEMHDGAAVVVAIMRAATGGKAQFLAHILYHHCLTETGWASWCDTMAKYADWPDDQLPALAKALRAERRRDKGQQAALPL